MHLQSLLNTHITRRAVYFRLGFRRQWFLSWPWEIAGSRKTEREEVQKQKKAGVTCCRPWGNERRIYLASFLPPAFSSTLFSLPWILLLPLYRCFQSCIFQHCPPPHPHPPVCHSAIHLSLCSSLPHYPFTTCHFAASSLFPTPLSFPSHLQFFTLPLFHDFTLCCSLRLCFHLRSQLTSAMKKCSCARTEERATRTRSASVLQSLRGYCANSPAARRARTATPPLRRTSPRPPCCSALC